MVQISYSIALFCLKSKLLQPKTFTGVLFCDTGGPWKVLPKIESYFPNEPKKNQPVCLEHVKRVQFQILLLYFVWKVQFFNQKPSQEFYFVILKDHGKFGPKLNPAFQISPPKITQFVSRRQKGSKFPILLLSFGWKVNCLYQKLCQDFHFVTLKSLEN